MLQPPPDVDPKSWHGYFGKEANNRAWALTLQDRDASGDLEMLNAAHASAWHWQVAGTELNQMRARMLLAEVHASVGLGATALAYAEEMRRYFLGNDDTPDWEIAFSHAVYAHAAHAAGHFDAYRASWEKAHAAIERINDDEERSIVLETFRRIPEP